MQINTFSRADNFLRPAYWFGEVDARPAAVFRILLALILLKDGVYHLFLVRIFYSDDGVIPLRVLQNGAVRSTRFSLLDTAHETWMVQLFMAAWLLVLIGLLLGYRTRTMAVLNFIMIVSIHERNTFILNGADTVLRVLSFWAIFLPMGLYYSVDAVQRRWQRFGWTHNLADLRVGDEPRMSFALPLRAAQIQIALVYVFTFILKLPGNIWDGGDALHYALQIRSLTLPTGDFLLSSGPAWLLQLLTYFTLMAEASFAVLVFLPLYQPALRAVGLAMGTALHMGIAVLMSIPNFSIAMIFSYSVFCAPSWIVAAERWSMRPNRAGPLRLAASPSDRPLVLLLSVTHPGDLFVESVESSAGFDGWTVEDDSGNRYSGVDAWRMALAFVPMSRFFDLLLYSRLMRWAIWSVARFVVGNGSLPVQQVEAVEDYGPHPVWRLAGRMSVSAVLLPMLVLILWWNVYTIKEGDGRLVDLPPEPAKSVIQYSGMWQSWGMFAPYPTNVDGWAVVVGNFEDGTEMDLLTGQPVMHDWTRWLWGPDSRWKKFISNMRRDRPRAVLEAWGGYYCREYNVARRLPEGQRLARLEIKYYSRRSYAPGGTELPLEESLMWRHWCFDEYRY